MIIKIITLLPALLLAVAAWEFNVYDSTRCQQGLLKDNSGTEDQACTEVTKATRDKFILYKMGDCSIKLYSGTDNTCPESNFQQIYDSLSEEACIAPRFA